MPLYVGLVHFPVYNKHQETIASAITPLDIHDFARLSKTYGIKGFFVLRPLKTSRPWRIEFCGIGFPGTVPDITVIERKP